MSEKPKNPDTKENNIEIEKRIDKELNRLHELANKELNHLRELAARELNHLQVDCNKEIKILNSIRESRWMSISIIAVFVAFFCSVILPYLIIKPYVKNYINERLIGPELGKVASSKQVYEFMLVYIKAQSDDSEAFEQSGRWGVDKSFPFYHKHIMQI